jgi:hypothetical protein
MERFEGELIPVAKQLFSIDVEAVTLHELVFEHRDEKLGKVDVVEYVEEAEFVAHEEIVVAWSGMAVVMTLVLSGMIDSAETEQQ